MYRFRGSVACLHGQEAGLDALPPRIASNFGTYFAHVHTVPITQGMEQLHREFCVFLRGGQFALLATSQYCERCAIPGGDHPRYSILVVFVRILRSSPKSLWGSDTPALALSPSSLGRVRIIP